MKVLPFKTSKKVSIGVELEFQIIDIHSFSLISRAKEFFRNLNEINYKERIKPEITQSMIEINSSIHHAPTTLLQELLELQSFLKSKTASTDIGFCGGGTHPFQQWSMQKIYPSQRYRKISRRFRYLSKRATVFGQHIHVGCASGDDAIYLTHVLARYVPQFIALSASSPFYQGIDTGFFSARSSIFNSFPSSGVMPYFKDWQEFSNYFYKMRDWGLIKTMKDIYWDIRPKPEFGTVEIRVFDTPLTIKKSVAMAAYVQALALYLLMERPELISRDLYYLYNYNRFQASRFGPSGTFINPYTNQHDLILDDVLDTMKKMEQYTRQLDSDAYIASLRDDVINNKSDVILLRKIFKEYQTFTQVVAEQYRQWIGQNEL
ncbi:YbdK family carboxylate-amine ligase [Legionella oakridgensis]|uniref:YbdK family carboxylate-amine ligase n=1 Tax=Legionella oakridgensis TaxID=29423 RepID=UPI0003DE2129|nr:YbdK family carboxylate-amine ligase [Legionella oakridgensis]ETO93120.1 carboxylate-amine ligase, YbdK family [Legionella oakridgensis RV-2-2007]